MDSRPEHVQLLTEVRWRERRRAHEERVNRWIQPHLERRRAQVAHPVEDFLFTYYSYRPAALHRWHPGYGHLLEDGADYLTVPGYAVLDPDRGDGVGVTAEHVRAHRRTVAPTRTLLRATADRTPQLGCFGMHEWAMVYRQPQYRLRHAQWPLRLGPAGTDAVVETHRVACSHFDAFRFFTDAARPLNLLQPGRDDRVAFEQPGCLHAGMDLYKHAFRLSPMLSSELVADCFELARDIRVLDMRASPYDLSQLGYRPVAIETVPGKQEYAAAQRAFLDRGQPLRARLIAECDRLLAA